MAGPRDPFRVLSLSYDAAPGDVRRAFRRLARERHPDRGGSTDAFHEVRVAYGALADDLDGQRRQWRPAPVSTPRQGRPYAAGLDPREFPTCPVRITRERGRRTVTYDVDARPDGWRPGTRPPRGGRCEARVAASEAAPAFGVWVVPVGAHTFRCVFGPWPRGK